MTPRQKLRALVDGKGYTIVPGAYDSLTARLVQLAGFEAVPVRCDCPVEVRKELIWPQSLLGGARHANRVDRDLAVTCFPSQGGSLYLISRGEVS